MSDRTPTDVDVHELALRRLQLRIRTMTPATVVKYNPLTQEVDVQPVIQEVTEEGASDLAQVVSAPIAWASGGGWSISWHLQPGDTGYLVVPDRIIDEWLISGRDAPPPSALLHALTGAVFEPRLQPDKSKPAQVPGAMTLGRDDGSARIQISNLGAVVIEAASSVSLGSETASKGVARATDPLSSSAAMATWALAVEVAIAAIPATPPAPLFAAGAGAAGAFGTIHAGSGKVKADD